MLSRANRLNLRTERIRLEKEGNTHQSQLATLIYTTGKEIPSKFAVITSRRFAPKSSQRNLIKRLITEAIRHELSSLPRGLEVIIIPKKTILTMSSEAVRTAIIKELSSLK